MALPFRKPGGGFLNGVAGVITGYRFDAKEWKSKAGEPYTTLSVELLIKQDGADAAVKQFLQAGFIYDNHTISEDGQELISDDDRGIIAEDTDLARFLNSAIEAGLPEGSFVENQLRRLDGLVNQRFTFKRVVDVEGTKEFGKRKGKDGNEYNRDWLLVAEYHGAVEPTKGGKKAAPAAARAAAKTTKATAAAKSADADVLSAKGAEVLLSILADNSPIERNAISAKIVKYSTENQFSENAEEHKAIREALRKLVGSEDFLNQTGQGWTYDPKAKGQPVTLG